MSSNCHGLVEVNSVEEGSTTKPDDQAKDETESKTTLILVGVLLSCGFVAIAAIVVVIICWRKKKKTNKGLPRRTVDANPIYGTYSRGWDGEGEYGDGDKVYVTDTSPYNDGTDK